jgi:hypothetical protein
MNFSSGSDAQFRDAVLYWPFNPSPFWRLPNVRIYRFPAALLAVSLIFAPALLKADDETPPAKPATADKAATPDKDRRKGSSC